MICLEKTCDPQYINNGDNVDSLKSLAEHDFELLLNQVINQPNLFNWDYYKSPQHLRNINKYCLELFSKDYKINVGKRYLKAELPFRLPFDDDAFDMVLSGNLLFFYSDFLDFDFHIKSIYEMLRVSKEIRIYPINRADNKPSPVLDDILSFFNQDNKSKTIKSVNENNNNITTKIVRVKQNFRINTNKILHILKENNR